jgi:hypothetical protein
MSQYPLPNSHYFEPNTNQKKILHYVMAYYFSTLLIMTFEVPLIYRVTNSVYGILMAYLSYFVWIFLGFFLFYLFRAALDLTNLFRVSIFFQFLLCVYFLAFYKLAIDPNMIMVAFALRGVSAALFSLGYYVYTIEKLSDSKREDFSFAFRSVYVFLPVGVPLIGAIILKYVHVTIFSVGNFLPDGYALLFMVGTVINFLLLITSPRLNFKIGEFEGSIKESVKTLVNPKLNYITRFMVYDSLNTVLKTVIYGILGFVILKSEFNVGLYASSFAFLGLAYFQFVERFKQDKIFSSKSAQNARRIYNSLSHLIVLFRTSFLGLFVKSFSDTLVEPIKSLSTETIIHEDFENLSQRFHIKVMNLMLFREICLVVGRFMGLGIIWFLAYLVESDLVKLLQSSLVLLTILDLSSFFFAKRIEKD